MTSVPPQPSAEPHRARQIAESFGTDAERYDRARPSYPDALIERIVRSSPGTDVLDVGCGTGIAARQFQDAGCTVLGIEPDARMADFARARGLAVEVASFEDWDAAGRTFDIVVAAQSWHWVDPVAGAAKAARVLGPGGRLALFGHVYEPPARIAEAAAAAIRRVAPDSPFAGQPARRPLDLYRAMYASFAEKITASGKFGEVDQWRFDWQREYTRDEWLDLLPTTGGLTGLSATQLAEVLTAVGDAVEGDGFTMDYVTLAVTAPSIASDRGRR